MFKRFRGTPRIVALRGMVVALLGLATIGLGVWLWRPELVPQPHVPPGTSYATVVYSHIIHYLKLRTKYVSPQIRARKLRDDLPDALPVG